MAQNLARRMRPRNIDEIVGQKHLVGKGKIIRRMVETQLLSSMILYGLLALVKLQLLQRLLEQ